MVAIIGMDLVGNTPGPKGQTSTRDRFREVVDNAVLFEELGFDGYAVGERHHPPFLSSSPPVVLSHIAARTSRIRLFTSVTLLSVLDPVRAAEDYATLDHLSDGRLELIIGKGNGPEQAELFGIGRTEAWDTLEENYRLLRRLWSGDPVTWSPPEGLPTIRRSPLRDVRVSPLPLQPRVRVWHGSATAERSVELAAEFGDPLFSANGFNPMEYYARLVRHYRRRWTELGRDPRDAVVGAGHPFLHVDRDSQRAVETYRPVYERLAASLKKADHHLPGTRTDFADYDDYLERGSALIGSPEQVIDKIGRYQAEFGNTAIAISGHPGDLDRADFVDSLELFAAEVVPNLRRTIPDPPPNDPAHGPLTSRAEEG